VHWRFVACDAKQWTACKGKLDDSKKLDSKGERDARVVAARTDLAEAGGGRRGEV
jgi:hypothetical protein